MEVLEAVEVPLVDLGMDIDPEDYINIDMSTDGLVLVYKSVCFYLEKW